MGYTYAVTRRGKFKCKLEKVGQCGVKGTNTFEYVAKITGEMLNTTNILVEHFDIDDKIKAKFGKGVWTASCEALAVEIARIIRDTVKADTGDIPAVNVLLKPGHIAEIEFSVEKYSDLPESLATVKLPAEKGAELVKGLPSPYIELLLNAQVGDTFKYSEQARRIAARSGDVVEVRDTDGGEQFDGTLGVGGRFGVVYPAGEITDIVLVSRVQKPVVTEDLTLKQKKELLFSDPRVGDKFELSGDGTRYVTRVQPNHVVVRRHPEDERSSAFRGDLAEYRRTYTTINTITAVVLADRSTSSVQVVAPATEAVPVVEEEPAEQMSTRSSC